mgnify:FL=1
MAAQQWTDVQWKEGLSQEDKLVLVEFWAPWCGYCRRIGPALSKVAEQYAETVTVAQINIDDFPALADDQGVELVPTFLLYRGGTLLDTLVAPGSKAALDAFLAPHLK